MSQPHPQAEIDDLLVEQFDEGFELGKDYMWYKIYHILMEHTDSIRIITKIFKLLKEEKRKI